MDIRTRQQEAVLTFGRRANAQPPLGVLMQDAVALVQEILGADLSGVGEIGPRQTIALSINRGGEGGRCAGPLTRRCPLDSPDSMAAYTLRTASPTLSASLAEETRFADPFLRSLGVQSALCMPLHLNGRPYGTLGVYRTSPREFSLDDACFAETIAHLLSSSIARIKLEDELREQREFNSTVLEMVEAMVLVLDAEGRVVTMNRSCEETTGYSLEEARLRPFWNLLVDGEECDLVQRIFRNSRASKIPNQFEGYLTAKDGTRRKVSWSLKATCAGEIQSLILTGLDQGDRIESRRGPQTAKALAEQATKALDDLRGQMKVDLARTAPGPTPPAASQEKAPGAAIQAAPSPPVEPAGAKPGPGPSGKEKRGSVRRVYPYRQWIAPILEGRIPSRRDFFEVQCKDISGSGIAFVLSYLPEFENLIVGLGPFPSPAYFTARVMRVARIEQGKRTSYLVGCRFLERVSLPSAG